MADPVDHPNPAFWWNQRRRMAWTAMVSGVLYPLLVLFTDSEALGSIAGPFYVFIGMVVAAYVAAATWNDNVMGR